MPKVKLTFTSRLILSILMFVPQVGYSAGPSPEALDFIYRGAEPPPPQVPATARAFVSPDSLLAPAGRAGLACIFIPRTLPQSLLCEYWIRAMRTFGQQHAQFCTDFTDRVTNLGEGGVDPRSEEAATIRPGEVRQRCRGLIRQISELGRRIRSGQMPREGVAEAAAVAALGFNSQVRTWRGMRRRARATCTNDQDRQALDQAWDQLQQCTVELNQAFESIARER